MKESKRSKGKEGRRKEGRRKGREEKGRKGTREEGRKGEMEGTTPVPFLQGVTIHKKAMFQRNQVLLGAELCPLKCMH